VAGLGRNTLTRKIQTLGLMRAGQSKADKA